ncbi:MAG: hypothetical protein QXO21_03660, partial [Candidatus Anstonellales archaeon]
MHNFLRIILITIIIFASIITIKAKEPSLSDKDTTYKTDKAAEMFLNSMQQFFSDMSALQGKSDEEKLNIIFARGSTAIWNKNLEKMKEVAVEDITEFAKANAYASLFKQKAAEYMSKGKLNSSTLDLIRKEIEQEQDTISRRLETAVKSITITINFLKTWYTDGPQKAIQEAKTNIGDELCTWFVPSWGMYRMAQGSVEALCNYIMDYAFETALEGNIKKICPFDPKTEKEKFANWLIGLNDIKGFVETEWNDYAGYGGFWGGGGWYLKFTSWNEDKKEFEKKEGEEMKEAIIEQLTKMQNDLREKKKEFEKIEEQIRQEIELKTQEAKAANYKIIQLYSKIENDSKKEIEKINDFKIEYTDIQSQDNKESIKKNKEELSKAELELSKESTTKVVYKSIDIPTILARLSLVLNEIKDNGLDGYDIDKMNSLYNDYSRIRQELINTADTPLKDQQIKVLEAEENGLILEAKKRAAIMQDKILTSLEILKKRQEDAEKNFNEKWTELENEKKSLL